MTRNKVSVEQTIYDGQRVEDVVYHLLNRIEKLEDAMADYGLLVHEEDSGRDSEDN